jgi:hypothetical protein
MVKRMIDYEKLDFATTITIENITLHFSQQNPYGNEWTVVDDSYDCDYDSERGFYAIAPQGTGDTKEDALLDYLNQLDDLTDEDVTRYLNKFKELT